MYRQHTNERELMSRGTIDPPSRTPIDRTPDVEREPVEQDVEYPGLPTTCDGAEAVVHVEINVAQAAGAAAAESKRVIALTGDVAALHDINALELIARESLPVTIVAVNNDGGGIFSFLSQAGVVDGESFDAAFATPHGRSLAEIATAFGLPAQTLTSPQQLEEALSASGPMLVEVHTDREENVAVHRRLRQAVVGAIST